MHAYLIICSLQVFSYGMCTILQCSEEIDEQRKNMGGRKEWTCGEEGGKFSQGKTWIVEVVQQHQFDQGYDFEPIALIYK